MSDPHPRIMGLLLAAGRSTRMGKLKLTLPWGDGTVISSAYDALASACSAGIMIVLGDHAHSVRNALGDRPVTTISGDSSAPQLDSILAGLTQATAMNVDGVLVQPGDHPLAPTGVLSRIIGESSRSGRAVIPTVRSRGGHPVVIPTDVAHRIIDWAEPPPHHRDGGLKAFWRSHPDVVLRLPCDESPELLVDLDTPEAYATARQEFDGPAGLT
jgi:molybdenum cofactor cytidylyltransferase